MLWGWMITSIFSIGMPKSHRASIISRPLLKSVAESTEIFLPIDQVGWRSACSGVTEERSSAMALRKGPPEQVRMRRLTVEGSRPSRHWKMALCSLSTGRTRRPHRAAVATTSSPAITRISLLATARSFPDSRARRAGFSPAVPTIDTRTRSASGRVASVSSPSAPQRIFRPENAAPRSATPSSSPVQRCAEGNSRPISSRREMLRPPERPTISILSASERATRKALSPIEPVAPRTTTRFFMGAGEARRAEESKRGAG